LRLGDFGRVAVPFRAFESAFAARAPAFDTSEADRRTTFDAARSVLRAAFDTSLATRPPAVRPPVVFFARGAITSTTRDRLLARFTARFTCALSSPCFAGQRRASYLGRNPILGTNVRGDKKRAAYTCSADPIEPFGRGAGGRLSLARERRRE
jgi:hypothetical protein